MAQTLRIVQTEPHWSTFQKTNSKPNWLTHLTLRNHDETKLAQTFDITKIKPDWLKTKTKPTLEASETKLMRQNAKYSGHSVYDAID
jgi:hypothetical protein